MNWKKCKFLTKQVNFLVNSQVVNNNDVLLQEHFVWNLK